MKKALVFLFCLTLFVSCKNDTKSDKEVTTTENAAIQVLKGEFVYYENAAVLQTKNQIYGIIVNPKMHELNKKATAFKKEDTDMVPVEIKGIVKPKPQDVEGWPFQIEITDIITVSQPKTQDENTIKI
ncbi:hypothetical protein FNB79_05400 [Formosa sediminum]|uniref:NlpE C-terminal OB domain-containing protein n=1 Tax=Formosa sediminum TaxID=2594004 RepID=A0A516GPI1_9FLAO|nr:hypothetical protein [Formosa sediminum]QDO93436.1 hypothetical protein FNB79_05400 [Formosa sediminum]